MSNLPIEVVTEDGALVWAGRGDGRTWIATYRAGALWAYAYTAYRLTAILITETNALRIVVRVAAVYTPEGDDAS